MIKRNIYNMKKIWIMARSSLDSSVEEHLQAPIAVESVTLETTATINLDEQNNLSPSPTNDSDCYLNNNAALALSQIQSSSRKQDETSGQDGIDGSDQMMNPGAATPMSNAEIMNLLISRQKQEQEEQLKNNERATYSCEIPNSENCNDNSKEEVAAGLQDGKKSLVTSTDFQQQDGMNTSPSEFYATLENPVTQSYEVATYVTEDGQNGQVIITGGGSFPSDLTANSGGAVSLGENNVTTIELPDGQILSLGEEALAQIAGLGNFSGGSIQLATAQGVDGTQQVQYIIKQNLATKDNQYEDQHAADKKTYQCEIDNCSKQFSTPYRLKAHGRTHSGDTYTCYVCRKPFGSQSDLQKHSKTHLGQKEFVCEVEGCKKEYTTAHHLKVHKRQHSGERPFVCEWEGCGKMFTTGYGLKSHFRTHTNERPYKCHEPICTKAFKTSGDLQKHIRTHTGERPFVCTFEGCNRSFTTSNIRKVHLRTHTGEKPYKCEIENCGRTFASATNYKNHSRIHTGERPYVCEVPGCLKRFTEYSSLYKHNIVHTHQKPYTCTLCHKTYRQTSTLAMHKRTVHGTEDLSESEKQETVRVPLKRSKITNNSRLRPPSVSSTANSSSGYLQGMSLVINSTASSDQQFTAELSTQHLAEAGELPGAIAIPIQVTMNPDGTIAGAQGLNLTDGNGRMIPVNLSVSIPMSSFSSMNDSENDSGGPASMETIYPQEEKINGVLNILPNTDEDVNSRDSNAASRTEDADEQNSLPDTTLISTSIDDIRRRETSSPTLIDGVLGENRSLIRTELPGDNFDVDAEEGDVTDKYLTSHYRKDVQILKT